jgi:hypothetical protein
MPLPDMTDLTGPGQRPGPPADNGVTVGPPGAGATPEEVEAACGVPDARRALGRQLAALRKAAGYSQHEFAPLTLYGRSTLANVETGRQNAPHQFWRRCDAALDAGGALLAGFEAVQALRNRAHRAAAEAGRREHRAGRCRPGLT